MNEVRYRVKINLYNEINQSFTITDDLNFKSDLHAKDGVVDMLNNGHVIDVSDGSCPGHPYGKTGFIGVPANNIKSIKFVKVVAF